MPNKWDSMSGGMRISVKVRAPYYPKTGETDSSPETIARQLAQRQQSALNNALADLHDYGEVDPLLLQVEQGNPYIMRNPKAREVMVKALRGEGFKGGSGRKQTRHEAELMRVIYRTIEYLKLYHSMPIFDREEAGRTACELVAKHTGKSASTIRRYWKERQQVEQQRKLEAKKYGIFGASMLECYENSALFNPLRMAHEAGVHPTPDEVVIYFLTGEFREEERQEARNKLAQAYLENFAARVITCLKRRKNNRYGQLLL